MLFSTSGMSYLSAPLLGDASPLFCISFPHLILVLCHCWQVRFDLQVFFLKFERVMSCSTGYENRESDAALKFVRLLSKVHTIVSQTFANFEHHACSEQPWWRVLKYSDAEPENFSRTPGSKPEIAVKLLWGIVFAYWKNITSTSMKNASCDSKPEKQLSEHLAQ